ncbi:MAG: hypothetical protein H7831_13315 [Magnetococcus sp. WYHC-3]
MTTTAVRLDPSSLAVDARVITCVIPDDGTEQKLVHHLKEAMGIITFAVFPCRGIGVCGQDTGVESGLGRLRAERPNMMRTMLVVVPVHRVDEIFDDLYHAAGIHRPGGGMIYQGSLAALTPFVLPSHIAEEQS